MLQSVQRQWIHVMDDQIRMDFVTRNAQITTIVPCYDEIPDGLPFSGPVEALIDPSIVSKRLNSQNSSQLEIAIPLEERFQSTEL